MRGSDDIHDIELLYNNADYMYTSWMKTYIEDSGRYRQFYIYTGTAKGAFHGARFKTNSNESELLIGIRDPLETKNIYNIYYNILYG